MSADDAFTWDVYGCICGLKANPGCPAWVGCNRGEVAREAVRQAQQAEQRLARIVVDLAEAVPQEWRP